MFLSYITGNYLYDNRFVNPEYLFFNNKDLVKDQYATMFAFVDIHYDYYKPCENSLISSVGILLKSAQDTFTFVLVVLLKTSG